MTPLRHLGAAVRGCALVSLPPFLMLACTAKAPPPPPPAGIKAAIVLQRDVPIYLEAIGQTRGNTETEILARVEGYVEKVNFQEGTMVSKGQLLYTLDPHVPEATLAQVKGNLAEAEAQWVRTQQDVERFKPLVANNAVSRQEYETSVALERAAAASVEAARAAERRAEVDLGYTKVTSPVDGLIGRTEVQAGTLVGRGAPTLLTRISKIDPIHVRFTLSEQDYLRFARAKGSQPTKEEQEKPLQMVLADGSTHPEPGHLVFVDRNVDPESGTILLEASFPNPDRIVRPGQYAKVRATVEVKPGAILVPQRAVQEIQGIYSIAVLKADDTVDLRNVRAGERVGSLWVIDSGLKPGDRIVVEGMQKVRQGAKVTAEQVTIDEGAAAGSSSAPGT